MREHAIERGLPLSAGRTVGVEPEHTRDRLRYCGHRVASSEAAAPGVLGRERVGSGRIEHAADLAPFALDVVAAGHGLKQDAGGLGVPLHGASLTVSWGAVHVSRAEPGAWLG
jgi:hypothetical protein